MRNTIEIMEKICDDILETQGEIKNAQNIGINVLDKYGQSEEIIVAKLQSIAFYVQTLARSYLSQYDRAEHMAKSIKEVP